MLEGSLKDIQNMGIYLLTMEVFSQMYIIIIGGEMVDRCINEASADMCVQG